MSSRRAYLFAIATAGAAVVLTACSSTTSGSGSTGGSGSADSSAIAGSSAGATSSVAAPSPTAANSAESLAALLQQGLASTSTAHLALAVTTGGQSLTGSGNETLAAGKLTALDLSETVPGAGSLRIIQVDGKTYVKLPPSLTTSGKPYTLVSAGSSNSTIRGIAGSLNSTQSSASAGSAGVLAAAASSVKAVGPATVAGVRTTHYSIVVDPSRLPATYPGKAALAQAGITSLPVELYVDSAGRPVRVTENFTASGQKIDTTVSLTDYNKPATITAPPADQVSTD